jgi:hypothetical protein
MWHGSWSPTNKKTNTYNLEHYLIEHFGNLPLRDSRRSRFRSGSTSRWRRRATPNQWFGVAFPTFALSHPFGEEAEVPDRRSRRRRDHADYQSGRQACDEPGAGPSLLAAIKDLHGLCLMFIGIFSGPRASEAMGFKWKYWTALAQGANANNFSTASVSRSTYVHGSIGSTQSAL